MTWWMVTASPWRKVRGAYPGPKQLSRCIGSGFCLLNTNREQGFYSPIILQFNRLHGGIMTPEFDFTGKVTTYDGKVPPEDTEIIVLGKIRKEYDYDVPVNIKVDANGYFHKKISLISLIS